jgi:pyridoxine/pyridoxamine 5'-phosphate oxidase
MTRSSIESIDPLTLACAPPADETPEQREARLHQEAEAKRVSDAIDDELKAERAELKKKKRIVKVLLLGQAESGMLLYTHIISRLGTEVDMQASQRP